MRSRIALIATSSVVVSLAFASPASAAPKPVVSCGASLSADAYLASDLTCAEGLTITRTLTLDLRGHRLTGAQGATGAGITVIGGSPRITNGRIDHWGIGIDGEPELDAAPATSPVAVTRIKLADNRVGLNSPGNFIGVAPTDFTVDASSFTDNTSGIAAGFFGGSFVVTHSTFSGNVSAADSVEYSSIRLSGSRLINNRTALSCDEGLCSADNSIFRDNDLAVFTSVTGVVLTKNIFDHNTTAVSVSSILGSSISTNLFIRNKVGLKFTNSSGIVKKNAFFGNGVGIDATGSTDGITLNLTENQLAGNGSGIYLTDSSQAELKSNTSLRNTQWGIYAPGAIDLGGNKAAGNGRSPQCVGVKCS